MISHEMNNSMWNECYGTKSSWKFYTHEAQVEKEEKNFVGIEVEIKKKKNIGENEKKKKKKNRQCACQHHTKLAFWWESIDSWWIILNSKYMKNIDGTNKEKKKKLITNRQSTTV